MYVDVLVELKAKKLDKTFTYNVPSNMIDDLCMLGEEEVKLRKHIFERYNLTARGMGKLLKVARTIADLDGSKVVLSNHILEALSYRINELGLGDEHMGKAPFGGREDLFAVAAFVVVIGVIVSMRFAVEFEDEAMFVADEINDVRANGLLPLEFPRRCS